MRLFKRTLKVLATFGYILALAFYSAARGLFYRVKRRAGLPVHFDEAVRRLRQDGFAILEEYYSPAQVEHIAQVVEAQMREEMGDYDHINRISYYRGPLSDQPWDGGVYRLFGVHTLDPALLQFRRDPVLKGIIEAAFHTSVSCQITMVQENLPQGAETRGFHLDMYAPLEFKAFLFLTDVTEDSHGPYTILRGSHRWHVKRLLNYLVRGLRGKDPVSTVDNLSAEELAAQVKFKVRKGSVVLSIQQAIHRGWPHTERKRLAVVNYYYEKIRPGVPDFEEHNRLGYRYSTGPAKH